MTDMVEDLTLDMIPSGLYKKIAKAIGVENLYRLSDAVGGGTIYIPKPDSIIRPVRDARIREEFNGYNHSELAKKYNVTDRWVRLLCGKGILEGQLTLDYFLDDTGEF